MSILSLKDMRLDLEQSAAYFESLSQIFDGHATYLKAQSTECGNEDLKLLESHAGNLAKSMTYIKSAALRIAKGTR
jgi:hypothetical protein